MNQEKDITIDHIRWNDDRTAVIILDQTLLPNEERYCTCRSIEEMVHAIQTLQVRGAPAIGIFTAFSLAACASSYAHISPAERLLCFHRDVNLLIDSRPTAVNLSWAAKRMTAVAMKHTEDFLPALQAEALNILNEDISMCRDIARHGLSLLRDGAGILTHCNAGPLATSRYGTALGPILLGTERGMGFHVYADETRPLLQGARLTSWELHKAGVDVTVLCDNMVSYAMAQGLIDCCFVGCDRIAANGDTANKIGTSGVAILARHYGIPFYVLGPTSSIDPSIPSGEGIPIEQRDPEELRSRWYEKPMIPEGVSCLNPAFDITDHSLISGIVTEKGILAPPYGESIAALFR